LPPAPTAHAELGQSAAVAVVTTLMQAEVALTDGRRAGFRISVVERIQDAEKRGPHPGRGGALNSVLRALGENWIELCTTLVGLAVAK